VTNRGAPTPPIEIGGDEITTRFAGVAVGEEVVAKLRDVCADVHTDDATCTEAARDWWPITMAWALKGEVPARAGAVARPTSAAEVAAVLAVCTDTRVPVTTAGGRSGVCGASVPVAGGIVLDTTAMEGVVAIDDESLLLTVLPGTFGDVLEDTLRGDYGVTVGHWPQSMALSTVGGWLACRGAGQYSTRYGKIEDIVVGLEVALADGSLIRTGGDGPRAATGPDFTRLFVGSEGTLGVITEATLRLHPLPGYDRRAAYGFTSFAAGNDACRRILRRGATPAVLRLYDERESRRYVDGASASEPGDDGVRGRSPRASEGTNVLLVLDEGDPAIVDAAMTVVAEECADAQALDAALLDDWLGHRNDTSALQEAYRKDIVVDTTEIAARWSALPAIYDEGVAALKAVNGMWVASAHQSHSYTDGACVYFTWAGQPPDGDKDGFYRDAWAAIMGVVAGHGGAVSHHHGMGLNRGPWTPNTDVLAAVKGALDPHGILNPGKLGLTSPFGPVAWP
jgi:alkyldihydroxyacetonephosphate synthase